MTETALAQRQRQVALVDLIDRLIDGGVVVSGDVMLSIADIDLVYLGLRLVLAPATALEKSTPVSRRDDTQG
jgi:hypothetical protein